MIDAKRYLGYQFVGVKNAAVASKANGSLPDLANAAIAANAHSRQRGMIAAAAA